MEKVKEEKSENKKVFFITSNLENLDDLLKYELQNNNGVTSLRIGFNNAEMKATSISKKKSLIFI